MNAKFLVAISFIVIEIVGTSAPARASAPTIDQLVANPKMLTAELDRCKQLGMAANNDARCHTAWQAENKQFFGKAPTYTQKPVNLFGSYCVSCCSLVHKASGPRPNGPKHLYCVRNRPPTRKTTFR